MKQVGENNYYKTINLKTVLNRKFIYFNSKFKYQVTYINRIHIRLTIAAIFIVWHIYRGNNKVRNKRNKNNLSPS